jgi:hypothetical protein
MDPLADNMLNAADAIHLTRKQQGVQPLSPSMLPAKISKTSSLRELPLYSLALALHQT